MSETVVVPEASLALASIDLLEVAAGPVIAVTRDSLRNPDLPVPDLIVAHQVFLI